MKSIFIISGGKGSGKTAFLLDILALLQMNGFGAGGFVSMHEHQSDSYQIRNLKTNDWAPLMQRVATFEQRPKHFTFFPEGVEVGKKCIQELFANPPDIAVVDEIGGYELAGELWSSGFTQLVESSIPLLFTTKEKHIEAVVKKWNIKASLVFHSADFGDPQKAFEHIKKFL